MAVSTARKAPLEARGRPERDRMRVLVADDDREMRQLVVHALDRRGYEAHEAADGGRLLARMTSQFLHQDVAFDLIISDVRMPICDGLQILRGLRRAGWSVPVILMTAFPDEETRAQAEAFGAVVFDKPFELADLIKAVADVLPRP